MTNAEKIEAIQNQILELQTQLVELKKPKLSVIRTYTGEYFDLYEDNQYRRLVSEGIPIWEQHFSVHDKWIPVDNSGTAHLEEVYAKDCMPT